MASDHNFDKNLVEIREKLNQNKIKLWLSPFINEKGEINEDEIKNLANGYSSQLSIPFEVCVEHLRRLQKKALDNIQERNNYQNTGVAALKVRVPIEQKPGNVISIFIELSKTGISLKQAISKEVSVPTERLRVIFQGKIMKDDDSLMAQGVKHGLHLMAIVLEDGTDSLSTHESHTQLLNSTKADIKLLAEDKLDYLQVADQSGKILKLPSKERKSLLLAMTLHEKGRGAMKREDFPLALVMLLEAEKEFSFCNSELLKSVDNYGLLNLDIVWCYLNLQSLTQLPDAEERLYNCELSFHQSYGPNLERLIALKGSAGNESALFMRLHLLQAIVLYHQNKLDEAKELFKKTEQELKFLEVDHIQLSHLTEMGYETTEARLALREASGDLNTAVNIIENKRQKKQKNEEAEQKERELKREKKKLGKCINGDWIEPQFHKALMSMGYSHEVARWALAQSCNNICNGVNLIQEHPEFLPLMDTALSDSLIEQVTSVGFEPEVAKLALKKHHGDVNKAVEELALNDGSLLDFSNSSSSSDDSDPSTSAREHNEAYSRISEGISHCEEDHLDLNLIAETAYLEKYKNLITKR